MRFGHFDDQNKEYVITTPQTPLPWINYLGSEDFFSLVSNTAGGYSFYLLPRCAAAPADPLPLQQLPAGYGRPPYLYQGWRYGVEPRLAANKDRTGQLHLPPWSGLHDTGGQKERRDGTAGAVCAQRRCL